MVLGPHMSGKCSLLLSSLSSSQIKGDPTRLLSMWVLGMWVPSGGLDRHTVSCGLAQASDNKLPNYTGADSGSVSTILMAGQSSESTLPFSTLRTSNIRSLSPTLLSISVEQRVLHNTDGALLLCLYSQGFPTAELATGPQVCTQSDSQTCT